MYVRVYVNVCACMRVCVRVCVRVHLHTYPVYPVGLSPRCSKQDCCKRRIDSTNDGHITQQSRLVPLCCTSTALHSPPSVSDTQTSSVHTHLHLLEHEGMVADLPQLNNRIHECSCAASTLEGRGRRGAG